MNIIIASDSFKGSLTTSEVAHHIKEGVMRVYPNAHFEVIPMADGGEGTVEAMISNLGGHIEYVNVCGPLQNKVKAYIGILNDGKAIIEMAAASGLPLVKDKDIMNSTTYGTGQLIKKALDMNCKHIYIGIGGSATNDGGVGMAQALGVSFKNKEGNEIALGAKEIADITHIDMSNLDPRIHDIEITIMSDVNNPLCGKQGASTVFGPQKGASNKQIEILDSSLSHLADECVKAGFNDVRNLAGAGAAGGLGFALVTFLNANMHSGIESVLEAANFTNKLDWADLVITGEGRIDEQSIMGKVPSGIAKYATKKDVPVAAVVGCIGKNARIVYEHGISAIESCIYAPSTLEEAMKNAAENVEDAAERLMRMIAIGIAMNF